MRVFFNCMIVASHLIACGITLICDFAFFSNRQTILRKLVKPDVSEAFGFYLKLCTISGLILTLLSWVTVTGGPEYNYQNGYVILGGICSILSCMWVVAFFVNVIASVYARYCGHKENESKILEEMRRKCLANIALMLTLDILMSPGKF